MAMRTFSHLYDNYDDAVHTVQALETAGIPHESISLVSNNADSRHVVPGSTATGTGTGTGAGLSTGTVLGGGAGLLTGLGLLAIPGVGPVVAAGWLVATLTGAGIGAAAGGLLGSLVHAGVPEADAHTYAEGVRRGGTLVTVRSDDSQAASIESVFEGRSNAAVDIGARRAEYETGGWTSHGGAAEPYTPDELEAERARRRVL